ncbi:Ig-like domain-containing protein [Myxococcota bacterium]|nr:Ig-like domain-containing protein [Myxococcota bacterium]
MYLREENQMVLFRLFIISLVLFSCDNDEKYYYIDNTDAGNDITDADSDVSDTTDSIDVAEDGDVIDNTAKPEITMSPVSGSGIFPDQSITFTFNVPIDSYSFNNAFKLIIEETEIQNQGTLEWNSDYTSVTFSPSEPYTQGRNLYVSISGALKSLYDVYMGGHYEKTLRVKELRCFVQFPETTNEVTII